MPGERRNLVIGSPPLRVLRSSDLSAAVLALRWRCAHKVSGALEGEFVITEERNANEFVITRDTSWKAMLGEEEHEATEEEIAALEAKHGPFLPADGEG